MTTRHLELTREKDSIPFAVMDTTSDPGRMELTVTTSDTDKIQSTTVITLTQREAQQLANALDAFSFNFLDDTED